MTAREIAGCLQALPGVYRVEVIDDPPRVPLVFAVIVWGDCARDDVAAIVEDIRLAPTQFMIAIRRPPWWFRAWRWVVSRYAWG